jgi:hypothetical protein
LTHGQSAGTVRLKSSTSNFGGIRMNSRNSSIFCLSLLLALPLVSFGQSQLANGSVVVTATDPDGAVMSGVIVKLLNKDTGFARSLLTNDDGRGCRVAAAAGRV